MASPRSTTSTAGTAALFGRGTAGSHPAKKARRSGLVAPHAIVSRRDRRRAAIRDLGPAAAPP